jgi:plasmid stabilization system protein ParE
MAYRFEFAPRALRDANETYEWIAQHSPRQAARWYRRLFEVIEGLATHPRRCPLAPENDAHAEEVRQLLYGRRQNVYRILYVIRGDVIRILAVRHGARQPLRADQLIDEDDRPS